MYVCLFELSSVPGLLSTVPDLPYQPKILPRKIRIYFFFFRRLIATHALYHGMNQPCAVRTTCNFKFSNRKCRRFRVDGAVRIRNYLLIVDASLGICTFRPFFRILDQKQNTS